jgi:hypothetical protein
VLEMKKKRSQDGFSKKYIVVAADSGGALKSAHEENICYT